MASPPLNPQLEEMIPVDDATRTVLAEQPTVYEFLLNRLSGEGGGGNAQVARLCAELAKCEEARDRLCARGCVHALCRFFIATPNLHSDTQVQCLRAIANGTLRCLSIDRESIRYRYS